MQPGGSCSQGFSGQGAARPGCTGTWEGARAAGVGYPLGRNTKGQRSHTTAWPGGLKVTARPGMRCRVAGPSGWPCLFERSRVSCSCACDVRIDQQNYTLILQSLVHSFLAQTQAQGITPKSSAAVELISSLGNAGRVHEAEAVFAELRHWGLQPRTRSHNALLKGYVKTGSLKDAEQVLDEMEHCAVAPDERTYSLLIDDYTNAGRWESARILIKEMEANNVRPNSFVFSRILASFRD
ncbi:hypothetical protein KSP40_PGU020287 [Platanthera guangdongensis]|uniref:Pentatricopeptide repeat-containing protein n=1 Tax=Platanthera guangdongensis TaxID=2320717 RepID=A0ABR2MCD8_9ASPA